MEMEEIAGCPMVPLDAAGLPQTSSRPLRPLRFPASNGLRYFRDAGSRKMLLLAS